MESICSLNLRSESIVNPKILDLNLGRNILQWTVLPNNVIFDFLGFIYKLCTVYLTKFKHPTIQDTFEKDIAMQFYNLDSIL